MLDTLQIYLDIPPASGVELIGNEGRAPITSLLQKLTCAATFGIPIHFLHPPVRPVLCIFPRLFLFS